MSKANQMRIAALERRAEGQKTPRPCLVGIMGLDGAIRASVPGFGEETFADEAALHARAAELGLDGAVCARIVDANQPKGDKS